ncbi:MAG: hypothetical protein J6L84_02795 [Clostridiales bacterium]|nr:hypothetical protein [Clostridiales bacterium]MBP3809812.1 hypothetical protein [Clostridiales bacterium]
MESITEKEDIGMIVKEVLGMTSDLFPPMKNTLLMAVIDRFPPAAAVSLSDGTYEILGEFDFGDLVEFTYLNNKDFVDQDIFLFAMMNGLYQAMSDSVEVRLFAGISVRAMIEQYTDWDVGDLTYEETIGDLFIKPLIGKSMMPFVDRIDPRLDIKRNGYFMDLRVVFLPLLKRIRNTMETEDLQVKTKRIYRRLIDHELQTGDY